MTSLHRIVRLAPQLHRLYLGIAVSSVLAAVLALATPFLIGAATDRIVAAVAGETGVAEAVTAVTWLAVAFLAVEVATTLVVSVGGYWGDVMAARMRTILSTRYFEQLLHLPQRYFDTAITGRVVNLNGDNMMINTNMLDPNAQVTINRGKIEESRPSPVSMMPEGLLSTLNQDEVLDLVAYLLSRGDRNSKLFQ